MYWDSHMHTQFSGDSETSPEDMIQSAIHKGLSGICITDHMDYDYPEETNFEFDPSAYFDKLRPLALKYQNRLDICIGIELGLQPHLTNRHRKLLSAFPFDQVIGSSHLVHGADPYYPHFYEGKTEEAGYLEYFESILENIAAFDDFDIYGHIDYVVRYGPNKNKYYSYEKYADVIDAILKALLAKGKGIELNTAGFKYGLGHPNPTEAVLKRYRELGGEILTLGSDAHKPDQIAYDFHRLKGILASCGFEYFTLFKERKPIFVKL